LRHRAHEHDGRRRGEDFLPLKKPKVNGKKKEKGVFSKRAEKKKKKRKKENWLFKKQRSRPFWGETLKPTKERNSSGGGH